MDTRIEAFLEGICYESMKKNDLAATSWTAVTKQATVPGIKNLVSAWALRKLGKAAEGEMLLKSWGGPSPSPMVQWCLDVYEGKAAAWDFGPEPDGSRIVEEMVTLIR
jgi:hypothetical protein